MTAIMILALLLLLVAPGPSLAQSPLPKEGSAALTTYFTGTIKILPAGQDFAMTYEALGITTNDAGQGFLHNVAVRCVGGLSAVKGQWENEQGMCSWMDKDGDQAFLRYSGAGSSASAAKIRSNLVGGTGKYTGLTGTGEATRTSLRATMEGTSNSISKATFNYKFP